MAYPGGKAFAFTILDDTDNATVANVGPVYDFLNDLGFRTTKSLWAFPSRDHFTGQTLHDEAYVDFLKDLNEKGFELCLHSVGSGAFTTDEIAAGYEHFKEIFGFYPTVHANHAGNPDNLYWRARDRFAFPMGSLIQLAQVIARPNRTESGGHDPASPYFWGQRAKRHIKYIRNLTFNRANTLACDPRMPYAIEKNRKYSNYWFSSSDGHTIQEFNALTSPKNVERLAREEGACIVYTHFASGFVENGELNEQFKRQMTNLAGYDSGWFVPVSTLLDHLLSTSQQSGDPGYFYGLRLSVNWLFQRVAKKIRFGR